MRTRRAVRSKADLLGDDPELDDSNSTAEKPDTDWAKLRGGVSITWLSGFLKMDPKTVKKRLAPCSPLPDKKLGQEVFDPAMALSYLVKPRFDIKDYLKTMNPSELPPMLRKEFWEAETKRVAFMERAGDLWSTAEVVAVLADASKRIKTQTQVWADDVEREAGLNHDQYDALQKRVDALREDIYRSLCEMPKEHSTPSELSRTPSDQDTADEAS